MKEFDRDRPFEMPMDNGGEEELKRRDEENRRYEAELLKSVKIEETVGAKPGPKVQYLQYLTPGSVQYVVAVPPEEWERVKKAAGRAMAAEAEVESLRKDLKLNAAMLARQTDEARQAENRTMEVEDERDDLRDKLKIAEDALEEHCNACYRDALEPCLEECNVGIALDAIRQGREDTGAAVPLQTEGE